ncbi:hypothetical protein [Pacificispira sp.]|uniref:hypothetical protein n=1 Tax=Pacificispira sp. TaxID=2888761 RepID=UPI003BA912C1
MERLKAAVEATGSLKAWAAQNGLSEPYASQIVNRRRPVPDRVLATLGIRRREIRQVVYEPVN